METQIKEVKETTYELIYTDFMGRRQVMNAIKTREELFRRKNKYYNSKDCNAVTKEVEKTYVDGECIDIEKTIINE